MSVIIRKQAKLIVVFAAVVVVATTGIVVSQTPTTAQEGPKWYTEHSKCQRTCPSLDIENCNCFSLPGIEVEV